MTVFLVCCVFVLDATGECLKGDIKEFYNGM